MSNLLTTTRDQDYIKEHGIRKNYSAIVFIGISKFFSLIHWMYTQNILCKHLLCTVHTEYSLRVSNYWSRKCEIRK